MCYPASDYIIFSLRKLKFYEGRRLDIRAGVGGWINQTPKTIPVIWKLRVFVNCIFRALPVVGGAYISYSSHSKRSLAVILRSQTTFYAQRFANMKFDQFCGFQAQFWPKNGFRPPFSLIIKSILKIDPPRISKQVLSRRWQTLYDHPPSSTGLNSVVTNPNKFLIIFLGSKIEKKIYKMFD